MLLKSMSVSWMRIPDWFRFHAEEFPSIQASRIFMVQLVLPQLWFVFWGSSLLNCGWCIFVVLYTLPVALIYLRKTESLGVVNFPYDGSADNVSSFYCCNTSPYDQQFKHLQGNGNLADTGLKVLEQDTSRKKNLHTVGANFLFPVLERERMKQRYWVTTLPQVFQ